MIELRPYQNDATAGINRVVTDGKFRVLLVAPTGSGKTLIFTAMIKQYLTAGKRVVVIAHSREIINQTSLKLSAHDIEHGIILAGLVVQLEHPVQVCSIQTLWARAMRTDKMPLPPADLLVIDEAHTARPPPIARSSTPTLMRCCLAQQPHHAVAMAAGWAASST
jgi:DNA repair protein RadD